MTKKRNRTSMRHRFTVFCLALICLVALITCSFGFHLSSTTLNAKVLSESKEDLRTPIYIQTNSDLPMILNASFAQIVHEHYEAQRLKCLRDIQSILYDSFRSLLQGRESRVVLIDVAIHANLGDNILWKAATKLITDFGISPSILCYATQPAWLPEMDSIFPKCYINQIIEQAQNGGVVLLHAGGNWGDLYRFVHEGRLEYLKELTKASIEHNFTIVQLPQSITYDSQEILHNDDEAMANLSTSHFVLFTRQKDSFEFAEAHYPYLDVRLSPDIAYILGPILPSKPPEFDVVIQMRQDKEVKKSDEDLYQWIEAQFSAANMTFDYRDWWYHPNEHVGELSKMTPSLLGDVRLKAAVDMISNGKIYITNRLHGSIVSSLLGRYTFVVDTVESKLQKVNSVVSEMSDSCTGRHLHRATCGSLREAVLSAIDLYQSWRGDSFYY